MPEKKGATMSAPNTDPDLQVRRHRGPLIGMAVVIIVIAGLFIGWLAYETNLSTTDGESDLPMPMEQDDAAVPDANGPSTEPGVDAGVAPPDATVADPDATGAAPVDNTGTP
jgi:hypothetical protein